MPTKINGLCQLCTQNNALYRCPNCLIIYCSLNCYKSHKGSESCVKETLPIENNLRDATKEPQAAPPLKFTEEENERDRLKYETLQKIGNSDHLKALLCNKHLKDMLVAINNNKEPGKLLEDAMQIPIFTEFVDECLQIVEPDGLSNNKSDLKLPDDVEELIQAYEEGEIE